MYSKQVQSHQVGGQGLASVIHATLDQMIADQGQLRQAVIDQSHRILRTYPSKQMEGAVRQEAQPSTSVHPAKAATLELGAQVTATVIAGKAKLKSHAWTDREMIKIENEDLARIAYETSDTLPTEFQSCGTFIAYWRRERSRHGLTREARKEAVNIATTNSKAQDQDFKQEWDRSPALRAEFGDSFSTYVAYKRAEARGAVRIVSARTSKES